MLCRDAANNLSLRLITYSLFMVRQAAVGLHTIGFVGQLFAWPLRLAASMLQRPLNKVWSWLTRCTDHECNQTAYMARCLGDVVSKSAPTTWSWVL